MRFGIQWARPQPGRELTELAREIEDLGYSSLGIPDHYSVKSGIGLTEPCIAMTWITAVTTTLRVVQLVCNNDLRHPALFAWQMAHLDLLSDGRVEAGIGAGWNKPEYDALGIAFDRPGVRIGRLAEGVEIMRQFWERDMVSFAGTYYTVEGLSASPKPVQNPLPLLVGGNGTKTQTLAGQRAQICGTVFSGEPSDEEVIAPLDVARNAARAAGRDPAELEMHSLITPSFEGNATGAWPLNGDGPAMIDELHRRAALGITYFSLQTGDIHLIRRFGRDIVAKLV